MNERQKRSNKVRSVMVAIVWLVIPAGVLLQLDDVVILVAWLVTFLLVMVRDEAESIRARQIIREHQRRRKDFVVNSIIDDARQNGPITQALRRGLDDGGAPPVKVSVK